ncbi:MAG: CoA pyrophosphatase [Desulfuromonadales bacterium]
MDQRHYGHEGQATVQAAVAVILRPAGRLPELLLIERAHRPGDPWSGHLGFPGGRIEGSDVDARHAAERETMEEIGLDLGEARHILRLDDLTIPAPSVRVASFVYSLDRTPIFRLDPEEVAAAYWIPIMVLQEQARRTHHTIRVGERLRRYPALRLLGEGRPLLWGITYRLIRRLFATQDSSTVSLLSATA